jgi:hypothetical protein
VRRETRVSHGVAALPAERRVLARRGWAGEKPGLSEQPAGHLTSVSDLRGSVLSGVGNSFVNRLLDGWWTEERRLFSLPGSRLYSCTVLASQVVHPVFE